MKGRKARMAMLSVAVSPLDGPRTIDAIVSMWLGSQQAGSRVDTLPPRLSLSVCGHARKRELLPNPVRPLLLLLT